LSNSESAQRAYLAGKLRDARERFVLCARADCPSVVREDCETSLAQVDAKQPTVVVVARDATGHDLWDVRVYLDGLRLLDRLDGRSVPVDPGAHTFRYVADGYGAVEESVVVREGERQRVLQVQLALAQESARPVPAFALAGIAAVALGVGAYFGVRAL